MINAAAQSSSEYQRTQQPRFSPDAKLIVFSATVSKGGSNLSKGIAVMNADGTDVRAVTHNTPDVFDEEPSISPDGKRVLFTRRGKGKKTDVFVANLDGTGLKQITGTPEYESHPEFTADSQGVMFIRYADSNLSGLNRGALILSGLSGSKEQVILSKEYQVMQALPAPRGLYLILMAKLDATGKLLPLNSDNGSMITLVAPTGEINPKGRVALPAEAEFILRINISNTGGLTILAMGGSAFSEYYSYLVTAKGTEKIIGVSPNEYNLSPDGTKLITWSNGSSVYVKGIKDERGITIGNDK